MPALTSETDEGSREALGSAASLRRKRQRGDSELINGWAVLPRFSGSGPSLVCGRDESGPARRPPPGPWNSRKKVNKTSRSIKECRIRKAIAETSVAVWRGAGPMAARTDTCHWSTGVRDRGAFPRRRRRTRGFGVNSTRLRDDCVSRREHHRDRLNDSGMGV
jgi:hypothetical protein